MIPGCSPGDMGESSGFIHLTDSQLVREFSARPGLIPVAVDDSRRELIWLDLDGYHCYEAFFNESLRAYSILRRTPEERFVTSIGALASLPLGHSLAPAGFIFHGGRCGSTLLAKALARSRTNLVFSEAPAHDLIWKVIEDTAAGVDLYRRLVLAMGRRRLPSYQNHFIKFGSFHIMHFSRIRTSFPDTPALFLFRRPDAVLESFGRVGQPWLGEDYGLGRVWLDAGDALEDFYRQALALAIKDPRFRCFDYANLRSASLPAILKFFGGQWPPEEVNLMMSEFQWDSKSGIVPRAFEPKPVSGPDAASSLCEAYVRLASLARSVWK